ncbi:MAG: CoB--CoM heterodisulfide reductase iron-sulfur subunit A family protein [Methanomassiliicoccales archaeon]|nr:MAG: CoB--CoM heterodisulfide reductase iron-sulfur subunit A family protein [Methanomassiliicoccales archaeon]
MVIGGGIAGMQSSLDLADSGFKVYLLEKSPTIGGAMSQLDKTFPTNDCAMCIMAPKLVETGRHQNIKLITNADLDQVEGEAGYFKVTISKHSRRVDETKCTGCGICTQRCPVEVPDDYNRGFKLRKAIYVKYPQAVPSVYAIDKDICIGCGVCSEVCGAGAVTYDQTEEKTQLDVGSIIITPGFEEFDLTKKRKEYGYGKYLNVVSSLELERMLSATGPYGGMVLRPSDGKVSKKMAFIQCVGSRDRSIGNPYCSSVCCMFAIKEAVIAQEHNPGQEATIFFMDIRAFGKEFDDYYIRAEKEHGIRFVKNNRISSIAENPKTNNLIITYISDGELVTEEFDLVTLAVGMTAPKDAKTLSEKLGVDLNEYNFCSTDILFSPLETSHPGIFVGGAFGAPKDIPDSVSEASGAAAKASSIIASERGKLVTVKEYPSEREVSDKEPRIGVFVCHCGINIGGVVDVPNVVEYAKVLPNVAYAENNLYTCSQDTQQKIKEKIEEHGLNRVIVASCTPRTHQPLFQNTVAEAGLNPYLFEMANIRDQCSWVHMREPEKATEKARDLVRMAVTKARLNSPLPKVPIEVKPSALIVGGGISGMTAALELSKQGYETFIVEREDELGGLMKRIHYELMGEEKDIQKKLKEMVKNIDSDEKIHTFTNSTVKDVSGYVGNFKTVIDHNGEDKEIDHGIVIVTTGGQEYKPSEYLYNKNENVLTQLEFEEKLAKEGKVDANTIVMIQCVGSRTEERPYCSRVCCTEAMKNSLKIKEMKPDANVYMIYKDIRTYGFSEIFYEEAARNGIKFIRYDDESKPKVSDKKGLEVKIMEPFLGEEILIKPDLLILSAATIPHPDNTDLAQMLKVPLSKHRFFLEAHMKLRPVEFATEGIFLCGLAHSPKFFEECIAQASAAVSRAATILSKDKIFVEGTVSSVNEEKCTGCGTCEMVCPYGAIRVDMEELKAKVAEVLCKGCGTCGAACPEKAIEIAHFTDMQLLSQAIAALKEGST